jgi:hypothetical protein
MLYTYIVLPENEVQKKRLQALRNTENKLARIKKGNKFARLLLPENDEHRKPACNEQQADVLKA